jgi:hypothetical protein
MERNQFLEESKQRLRLEEDDAKYAEKLVNDEQNETRYLENLCEEDEEYARKFHDLLKDEILAADLHNEELAFEVNWKIDAEALKKADAKIAQEIQSAFDREFDLLRAKQEENDAEEAKKIERFLNQRDKEERDFITRLNEKDKKYSKGVQEKIIRENHRNVKYQAFKQTEEPLCSVYDDNQLSKIWQNAEAVVENVGNSICLIISLPYLNDLKIRILKHSSVEVFAKRQRHNRTSEKSLLRFRNKSDVEFLTEFRIAGDGVELIEDNLSYEYISEIGMLFVYIEGNVTKTE